MSSKHSWAAVIGTAALLLTLVVPTFALAVSASSTTDASILMTPDHTAPVFSPLAPVCSPSGICPSQLLKAYNVTGLQSSGVPGQGRQWS